MSTIQKYLYKRREVFEILFSWAMTSKPQKKPLHLMTNIQNFTEYRDSFFSFINYFVFK